KMKMKWLPSPDKNVIGYYVYGADFIDAPYTRLTEKPITATKYIVSEVKPNQIFMVKAVALQKSASGSYFNSSQGIFIPQPFEGLNYYAPETNGKKLSVLEDVPTEIDLPQVTGTDGVQLWSVSLPPEHGTLTKNDAEKYVYAPASDYAGKDRFALVAWDGMADSSPAEYAVDVLQVPDNPRPVNQTICLTDNAPVKVTLAATDPDEPAQKLTYKMTKLPNYGRLSGTPPAMVYYPQAELKDVDEFQFSANDGALESNPGTIKIIPPFTCAKSSEPKIIDGKLDDWKVLPIICNEPELFRLMGKKAWKGPADCSFAIGVAYDDKYLYIAVEVIDDQCSAVKDKNPWDQDGIEIRLDARSTNLRSANTGKNDMKAFLRLALSPSASASAPWLYKATKDLPAGTKYACVSNLKGFNAEIAIPLAYLNKQAGKEWDGFRLNVTVNDQDADKQVQLCWKPDWRAPESYPGSGSFIRQQPPKPKKLPAIPPAVKKAAPVVAVTKPAAPATATTKPAAPAH
ncbi:MAG: Ig-like domain-containing protein, partial [Victivallaceae bacterium]